MLTLSINEKKALNKFSNAELEKYAMTDDDRVVEIINKVGESRALTYLKSGATPDNIWGLLVCSIRDQKVIGDTIDKMIRALQEYESFASDKEAIKVIFRDQDGD